VPTVGTLQVTTSTTGDAHLDGYGVALDGADRGILGVSAEVTLDEITPGEHVVELSGVAAYCQVQGGSSRTVTVTAGATATVAFAVTCPLGILPGQSIQAAVDANPAGTTFLLASGTHHAQSVLPKSRSTFRCAPGAILTGDDVAIYAFRSAGANPDSVTIVGCIIENYNPPQQMGAILADGTNGWIVDSCEIRYNATGAIRLGHKMKVRWNNIHHNHMEGIMGAGDSILVYQNEIAFNNYLKEFDWGFEGGGTKFVLTNDLIVRGNYVHDNWGPGLWADINNMRTVYDSNRVEDNAGPGIYHEISFDAVIRGNTIKRNGFDFCGGAGSCWIWGGGIQISTSRDVEIYGNVLEDNRTGISVVAQDRGQADWVTTNIWVHDNTVTQRARMPAGAASDVPVATQPRSAYYAGIKFDRNTYQVTSGNQNSFEWADGCCQSWTQWQAYGNDAGGSLTVSP
jgi:hypothetical protein